MYRGRRAGMSDDSRSSLADGEGGGGFYDSPHNSSAMFGPGRYLHINDTGEYPSGERGVFQTIYYTYMPVCAVVGLLGNCMVFVLLTYNKPLQRLPTNVYLMALAGFSSIFLLSLLSFWFEQEVLDRFIIHGSTVGCKVLTWAAHVCDFCTMCLIVLVSWERFYFLFFKKRSISNSNARRNTLIIVATGCVINCWIFLVADVDEHGECDINRAWEGVYNVAITVETILFMAVPSLVIVATNVCVVIRLRRIVLSMPQSPIVTFHPTTEIPICLTQATNGRTTSANTVTTRQSITSGAYTPLVESGTETNASTAAMKGSRDKRGSRSIKRYDVQVTRSLLIITCTFIVFNIPNYAYRVIVTLFNVNIGDSPVMEKTEFWQTASLVAHIFLYTHHAVIFFLYIFNTPTMHKRLRPTAMMVLECYCLKPKITRDHSGYE